MHTLSAWLRQLTIRTRMAAAVATVLALFAVVGATAVAAALQMRALNEAGMTRSVDKMSQVGRLRSGLAEVRIHEKNMVIDYDDKLKVLKHQDAWVAAVAAERALLDALRDAATAAQEQQLATQALASLAAYGTAARRVIDQIQDSAYDTAPAADRMLQRAKQDVSKLEGQIAAIEALARAEVGAARDAFDDALRNSLIAFAGVLGLVVLAVAPLTMLNARSIVAPIEQARAAAMAIAQGDLTGRLDPGGRDEAAQLLQALAQMQQSLRRMVGDIRVSARNIDGASGEIATGNLDLSSRTEQTASSLQHTASSMEQLTGNVRQSADAARTANQLASSAAQVAARGGKVVAQVVTTMDEINTSSKKIADIIGVIDGIAFQTNILALNAAVEAARAGEQGRGFAVVASEVRSLAQRSADAAKEIKALIGASVDRVESGSKLVADAGSTMGEIVASVQRVADIIGEISAAAAEQSDGIGQVNGAVSQLDRMTQQNAALVEQSAAAAESLKDQATTLTTLMATFRLGDIAVPPPTATLQSAAKPVVAAKPAPPPAARPAPTPPAVATPPAHNGDWETF